ncbi:MAG: threonylcarbamoyl-AMP synthase [Rickettsiales bacterium]|nr:threonylcarbamoyl-AMP synthase [Rickettsiales bacterium]MCA0254132.1 threonylcarbamoyl-AMP synthase [Pseudomonadota bacterium]
MKKAVEIIKSGGLVAFPTETVYGLGADATNEDACLKIFQAKGRPAINPLIVHVSNLDEAKKLALFSSDAIKLASLWPGPLTMVLPKSDQCNIAKCVTAGLDTIAIRIPSHKIAQELITKSAKPIAAPSANKSGRISSTTLNHVIKNFKNQLFILNDTEDKTYGLESTIIDLTTTKPTILRYGFITPEIIQNILEKEVIISTINSEIKAPGMLLKHYSPHTNLRLNASNLNEGEVGLNFDSSKLSSEFSLNLSSKGDLAEAASNLFHYLDELDEYCILHNIPTIAVANIPNTGIGLAINDRLNRAAAK